MPSKLVVSVPGQTLKNHVDKVPDGVEFIEWKLDGRAPREHIDIVVPPYMGAASVLRNLEPVTTQLVQGQSIGYDDIKANLPAGHRFANAATVHEASTAELAVALILALQRGIPDFVRAADTATWAPARYPSLADRRVLIVGYGGVGVAIDKRLVPFDAVVTKVATRARDTDNSHVHGFDELPDLLADAEIVILAVPLTESTAGMADAEFLSRLRDGAMLVNIARGAVVDTDAMLAEAKSGRLRFALDVTDPEPLPDGHPLFSLPNVLISPHVGGATSAMMPRMGALLRRQIEHLLADEEPENVVIAP